MTQPPAPAARRLPAFLVWATWVVMTAGALGLVARYGQNVPFHEDWQIVPVLSGARGDWAAWLWSQNNEHRLPLPRLVSLLVLAPTRCDLRALMYVSVATLAAAAALLMAAAARARGRAALSDALFPVALLHPGNAECFLWAFQIHFALSILLNCALLSLLVRAGPPTAATALAATCCALGLALCGANGLAYAAAAAGWLFAGGVLYGRSAGASRAARSLLLAGAALTAGLIGVYFVGLSRPAWAVPPTAGQFGDGLLQFLSDLFGLHPNAWGLFGAAGALLLLATAGLLARVWRSRPDERWRALGLLLFVAASLALAAGVAWGRAATLGCLQSRYVTLTAPFLFCASLAWQRYGGPRTRARLPLALLLVLVLLLPGNTWDGLRLAQKRYEIAAAFLADRDAGLSLDELAARHTPQLHYSQKDLRDLLGQMEAARLVSPRQDRRMDLTNPRSGERGYAW
jgi:hypothetical protein